MMEPGSYLTVIQFAFEGASVAVKTFRKGLNYGKDAERLILGLEFERFRLQLWGENSGLTPPGGESAALPDRLQPIEQVLKGQLDEIERLVQNADELRTRYGLAQTEEPPTKSDRMRSLVDRMQQSMQRMRVGSVDGAVDRAKGKQAEVNAAGNDDDDANPTSEFKVKRRTSTLNRIRWAVKDVDKFEGLVKTLARMITKLNELLTESQQRRAKEDSNRINMIVVGSAVDESSLDLIRAAVQSEPETSKLRAGVERKALAQQSSARISSAVGSLPPLSLSDFDLPDGFLTMRRFLATKKRPSNAVVDIRPDYYLIERKDFDRNINPEDKEKLTIRMQRLVMLLCKPKPPGFVTPRAEGCIDDPSSSCWWMVLRFPVDPDFPQSPDPPIVTTPVSLLSLLQSKGTPKPPLEHRIALASAVCTTFSELYLSGWLHKSVRSDNILFRIPSPDSITTGTYSHPPEASNMLTSFLVAGFEYSRQESEGATIDKAKTSGNVAVAMYRHPNYQGDAAEGYKMEHDIYSLGLVLVEIALWMPLASFLGGKPAAMICSSCGKKRATATRAASGDSDGRSEGSGILAPDMKIFHAPHAAELKRRVIARAYAELGFRVGTKYAAAVKFCLEMGDNYVVEAGSSRGSTEIPLHPALEFYNNVVVPLASASGDRP
ncbi:prion-inhibition and propagation-domain-containing protein [Podospora didyma]|uniref:Prion-inhibition and propagation-domain-containing protein n=1 Tax=Podospora didyma TaxID=330526 RepID=A0AAE0KAC2_9PEZI|nr:prion-inhibition and propagation-domain-containing protein [Podospora didyma]